MNNKIELRISSDEYLERQFRKSDIINLATINLVDRYITIFHYSDLNCFYLYDYNSFENKKYKIYDPYDMEMCTSYYYKIIKLRDNKKYKSITKINKIFDLLFNIDNDNNIEEENDNYIEEENDL